MTLIRTFKCLQPSQEQPMSLHYIRNHVTESAYLYFLDQMLCKFKYETQWSCDTWYKSIATKKASMKCILKIFIIFSFCICSNEVLTQNTRILRQRIKTCEHLGGRNSIRKCSSNSEKFQWSDVKSTGLFKSYKLCDSW